VRFYADLHIHSKFSRATAKNSDLEHLAVWARNKGLSLLATGDFTHPQWMRELKQYLVPAEPGLFRLSDALNAEVDRQLPRCCRGDVRFILSVEISTIYKKGDRTRKVHHVVYAPDFEIADRFVQKLSKVGNLASDGRPILGLDSRDLLEMVLESGPDAFLIPAHIWTPWFSVLGAQSGFDAIDECYGDLAQHIFAVETGLSSDPPMNWRVSSLDRFRLVSNSDAHSPPMLAREACIFDTDIDYFSILGALRHGEGYVGTVEFYPEEGKYHLDGHRKCGVRLEPQQTLEYAKRCPVCGKPVTVGVMNRVVELADRSADVRPPTAGVVESLVPLPEILSEIYGVGPKSKRVTESYNRLIAQLGPELDILTTMPLEEINKQGSEILAEAISRLRRGEVIRQAGYDGEYGVIRLFTSEELAFRTRGGSLFTDIVGPIQPQVSKTVASETAGISRFRACSQPKPPGQTEGMQRKPTEANAAPHRLDKQIDSSSASPGGRNDILAGLDPDQLKAARAVQGPMLIAAGPGSGKTRTLTHRIAHLVVDQGVSPAQCLAIAFTRRAADEMRDRLRVLIEGSEEAFQVYTFHGFALSVLKEHFSLVQLDREFCVADQNQKLACVSRSSGVSQRKARQLLEKISRVKRTGEAIAQPELKQAFEIYCREMQAANLVDFDDLIALAVRLLEENPRVRSTYQERYPWISIDEYQDLDEKQYRLVKLLAPPQSNLCVIGDPDQAIYGFRGSDVGFFHRFRQDYPSARLFSLTRNYRSGSIIVQAASQIIGNESPELAIDDSVSVTPERIVIHNAPTEASEAEFVVKTIEQLIGGHSFFSVDSGRSSGQSASSLAFSDFAVLYRTSAQATALSQALARSGIPYQCRTHDRLIEQPGVQAVLQYLEEIPQTSTVRDRLIAAAQYAVDQGAGENLETDKEAMMTAVELLASLASGCGSNMARFRSEVALGAEVDTLDPRADRVSLLTLHAAKGLEFRVVFIVGCENGIIPLSWGEVDRATIEEERRLFYVGVTRARERLFLSHAHKRRVRGKFRSQEPSPFIKEIQAELLERDRDKRNAKRHRTHNGQLDLF
jgi:DNA helicase-2/ATP-dependent DNA helicase PcrA